MSTHPLRVHGGPSCHGASKRTRELAWPVVRVACHRTEGAVAPVRSMSEKLSFVLPVALGHTGRPGSDLDRMKLLFDSLSGRIDKRDVGAFLVITRPQDLEVVSSCISSTDFSDVTSVISENSICPELASDPDTFNEFPTRNKGWYRQQVLKLPVAPVT